MPRPSRSPARAPAASNSPAASADTTWVVTGAAGHVGKTLAAHLAARNSSADVRRLDVVGDGVDYCADVCDAAAVSKALRNPKPHLVFVHLASAGMSGAPLSLDGCLATTLVALFFGYGAIHTVGAYHDDEALRQLGCPPADGAKCSVGGEAYTVHKTEGTCDKVPEICLPAGMMWQLHMAPLFGTDATGVAERPVPSAGGARAPIPATPLDALKALDRPEGGGQETLEMYLARRLDPEHFAALDPVTRAYVEEHKRLKVKRDSEYMDAIATPCSGIEPYHDSWLNAWARSFALSGKAELECERKRRLAALLDTAKHGPGGKPS